MSAGTADRLIARLPEDERRRILEAVVASSRTGLVVVEHNYDRKLEGANTLVGRLLGVAFAPGGSVSDVLVVQPADERRRMVALSAAHVLRIRAAAPYGKAKPGAYRYLEVIAGPPVTRSSR